MSSPSRTCENCASSRVIASGIRQGQLACLVFSTGGREGGSCQFFTPESDAFRVSISERAAEASHRVLVKSDVESHFETNLR